MAIEKERKEKVVKKKKIVKKNNEKKEEVKEIKKEEPVVKEKKKKKNYDVKEAVLIMVLAIIVGALFGSVITRNICTEDKPKGLDDFNKIYKEISKNKYSNVSKNEMLNSSIEGLLLSLNDKYTVFNKSKNAVHQYKQDTEGVFNGLGINILLDESGKINITAIFDDSPAKEAGLEPGDVVYKLNDKLYNADNYDDFSYVLQSSKQGEKVTLEVLRANEIVKKEIKLDMVTIKSVDYQLIENNGRKIGFFKITAFANNTYDQFNDLYKKSLKDGIEGIILDVRCNGEGLIENAEKIASMFLEKGTVIYQKYNNGVYKEVVSESNKIIELPVVVLINDGTVAGGELIASTLYENINAPIVGTKSFGKGLIQKGIELDNGYLVLYTTEEWVTANKSKVEGVGIYPTVEVNLEDECSIDKVFEIALQTLEQLI